MKALVNSVVSALIGGIVGASVIFFAPAKSKFDKIEVRELNITEQATLLSADKKKSEVVIKNGSVLVANVLGGVRLVGNQVQGHIFIANRMLTSPDNLVLNNNTQWRFFTEIGSSVERGGEIIVRSATGAISGNRLDNIPVNGWAFRAGYADGERPDLSFTSNLTKEIMPVALLKRSLDPANTAGKTAANVTGITNPNPANTPNNINPITTPITTPLPNKPVAANAANTTNTNVNNPLNTTNNPLHKTAATPPTPNTPNIAGANPTENNKPR
ncbi:MAG: hypothetical protein LBP59_17165 [Planctomycetaceae bacterium]|nr:hypothetical protein [Planctomycetaceae bacterium]